MSLLSRSSLAPPPSDCGYFLTCSLCLDVSFNCSIDWFRHLLCHSHLGKVRLKCGTWDDDVMECCFVGFADRSVASTINVLEYFSKFGCGLVTEFVWFPERPNVGIFQFESRDNADKLFASIGNSSSSAKGLQINDDMQMDIRRLTDYMEFERKTLFPEVGFLTNQTSITSKSASLTNVKNSLVLQYKEIKNAVEIPDEKYQMVMELMKKLQTILEAKLSGCKLFLFRHWYLKLFTMGTNDLLIFVSHDSLFMGGRIIFTKYFEEPEARHILSGLISDCDQLDGRGCTFLHSESGLQFSLVDYGLMLPEAHTCQLVKHLCTFDPRARELMLIITYWAKINDIHFQSKSAKQITNKLRMAKWNCILIPEPSALEWLVMFFLGSLKVVPTVNQIIEEDSYGNTKACETIHFPKLPIQPDCYQKNTLWDIGDEKDNIPNVLQLAKQFFTFYGNYIQNDIGAPCILNTRNGKIIKVNKTEGCTTEWHFQGIKSKLTESDKAHLSNDYLLQTLATCFELQPGKSPVFLLHPLRFSHLFLFDQATIVDTWAKMSKTGKQLHDFLENVNAQNQNGSNMTVECSLKTALDLRISGSSNDDGVNHRGQKRKRS